MFIFYKVPTTKKDWMIVLITLGVIATSCIGCMGVGLVAAIWGRYNQEQALAPFKDHVQAYLQKPAEPKDEDDQGYIKGKIIPMNVAGKEIDYQFLQALPPHLRAAAPEEVGTIVWV